MSIPNYALRPHSELPLANLEDLYRLALDAPPGNFAEVGVYKGGSAWFLAHALKDDYRLHLFDTFTGIPTKEPGDKLDIGSFNDTDLPLLREKLPLAAFHVGIFPATLPIELINLSFVHVDCDQGSTCKQAIELLWPRMVPGGIMAFDDYPFEGIEKAIHGFFDPQNVEVKFSLTKIPYAVKA